MTSAIPGGGSRGFLDALYGGEVFLLPATAASLELARAVWERLDSAFGDVGGPRRAASRLDGGAFFERIGRLRREFYCERAFHERVGRVIAALGFDVGECAFDPVRLRVICHKGHEIPAAKSVYYPHRDTWYGHPQALVTWWIPLHDIAEPETFVFMPDSFDRPVPNDSEVFDYADWVKDGPELKIGWQKQRDGLEARYPGVTGAWSGRELGFSCRRGQNLLFSGAHFHRTLPQEAGTTRYSLDFRLVRLADVEAGRGAPNVDNRSRGSAVPDYIRLSSQGLAP